MTLLFRAAAEATEEAIINALTVAETMQGVDGHVAPGAAAGSVAQVMPAVRPVARG